MLENLVGRTIYLVNIDFPPISGPGVWRMLALAKYAAEAGARVHVFCAYRSFWHERRDETLLAQLPPNVRITRIKAVYENDIQVLLDRWKKSRWSAVRFLGSQLSWWRDRYFPDQIVHWVINAVVTISFLALRERPVAIVTSGPMHLVHVCGLVLTKLRRRCQWIMDYRDPWTGDPAYGQVHPGPYQEKMMSWLEERLVQNATWVTAVSPGFLNVLVSRFGSDASRGKFRLIPNGHDLEIEEPIAEIKVPSSDVVIHFNGTIQEGNDVFDNLLEGLVKCSQSLDESALGRVTLSFCGINRAIREKAELYKLGECLTDHGALTQPESRRVACSADVLLVTVRPDLVTSRGVVPAKLYEAMALGKPVLALVPDPSDVRTILHGDDSSICVDPRDIESICAALRRLLTRKANECLDTPKNAAIRRAMASKYMRKKLSVQMLELVERPTGC